MHHVTHTSCWPVAPCDAFGQQFLVTMNDVTSIQQSNVVTSLPTCDDPVGRLDGPAGSIPIVSLSQRFGGLPTDPSIRQYCLIIGRGVSRWGLLVDRVHRPRELPRELVVPLPAELRTSWCLGSVQTSTELFDSGDFTAGPKLVLDPTAFQPGKPLFDLVPSEVTDGRKSIDKVSHHVENNRRVGVSTRRQLLLFSFEGNVPGDQMTLGFPAAQIQEVVQRAQITPIPLARRPFVGLTTWRQHVIPVVDLDQGNGSALTKSRCDSRLVVARRPFAKDLIGFLAPSNVRSIRLPEGLSLKATDESPVSCFGAFEMDGIQIVLPDLDAMLCPRTVATAS